MQHKILIITCFICAYASAQDIAFKNISTVQGLSSNLVYNACQGPDGLLWIIANNQLDSYNEGKVTNYTNDVVSGIEDYDFIEIMIDNENIIWLKTVQGHLLFLDQNRKLNKVDLGTSAPIKILNLIETERGLVDLLTMEGHFHYDINNTQLDTVHLFQEPIYTTAALQISNEDNGRYLISANKKIMMYDGVHGNVVFTYDDMVTRGAAMINADQLVASTPKHNELFLIDIHKQEIVKNLALDIIKKYPQTNTYYRRIKHIDKDHIALTSGHQGLFIVNVHDLSIKNFAHDFGNPSSISSDNTFHLFANNSGNVFVTSRTSGLNIFNWNKKSAKHISSFVDFKQDNVFEGHISHIARDQSGYFWLASSQGLLKYDVETNQAQTDIYKEPSGEILSIICMYIDEKDHIWVGISGGGLDILDNQGNKIKSFQANDQRPHSLKSDYVYTITKGFDGKLWIGTSKGINKIDINTLQLEINPKQQTIPSINTAIREIKTIDQETFVGTWHAGSYIYSSDGVKKIDIPEELKAKNITSFAKDKQGGLYQGSYHGVLIYAFDSMENKYNFIERKLSGRILSIDRDANGYVWVATENVLYKVDQRTREMSEFTSEHGFTGGGFRMHASFHDTDGLLYYGMNTGMCFFDPIDFSKPEVELNPFITTIFEGNNKILVTKDQQIHLPAKENNIGFYYQNIDIWNARDIQYQYSISEDATEWIPAITNPVLIQNIEPGLYNVRLRASWDGENWTNALNKIDLNIAFPWWRSWWFYSLAIVTAIFGFRMAYQLYSRLKADKLEEQKYDESLKFFSFSMHKQSDLENEFWDVILDCIQQLNIDAIAIYLADHDDKCYRREAVRVSAEKHNDYLIHPVVIDFGEGRVGAVGENKVPLISGDLSKDMMNSDMVPKRSSKITIPIRSSDRILGIIDCEHELKDYFNERRLSFISAISTIIATKIEAYESEQERKNAEISLSNNSKRVSELEMKSLRSQMNPHFMFNSLNSINNFIVKNDQENASDYLTSFAQLMRVILENSRQDWVPLENELRALRLYIGMEKLRFENLFVYDEVISEDLNLMTTLIPPMLIQPYIENAIWHGLLPKKTSQCNLKLMLNKKADYLYITIEDDGIGIKHSRDNKSNFNITKKSFGLKIISERLDMINEIYNLNAGVQVVDKSEIDQGTGTSVILSMKIKTA